MESSLTAVPLTLDSGLEPPHQVRITIVYDNTAVSEGLAAEWGFAAWIEYGEHTVLFDTGPDGTALLGNMAQLGLEPEDIDVVVLSHIHGDHTGGLTALLGTGIQPVVYAPAAFPEAFQQGVQAHTELVQVLGPVRIFPGLHSTGQLGGDPAEQALVVETSDGMVVVTGCAHPGILRIVRQARSLVQGEIALVMGGFHLADTNPETVDNIVASFRDYGVKQVCPTHCTGERPIRKFADEYGDDYFEGGAGRVLVVGSELSSATGPASAGLRTVVPYWPTDGWRTSTPEEQGMDSTRLALMLAAIQEQDHAIDSVQVVRNGYLVVDAYMHPFGPDKKHAIRSCTKSIVSALIGIAIEQGALEGIDQPVLELFPSWGIANLDGAKKAMTLEHLLTMATGLECRDSYLYRWQGLQQMQQTDDWLQYVLDLPMIEEPGTRFEYCNGASFLLSAIMQEATGASAAVFADEHLFSPLGIKDVEWPSNPRGVSIGWGQMKLQPHDMAKIGYLYLNGGRWGNQQVVPEDWVLASTQKHIPATLQDGYGYQWWVSDSGYYMALGYGGQFIFVVPDENLVAVFVSELAESDFYVPQLLLDGYIVPAAQSAEPLPPNPDGVAELEARTRALAQP
jgi:metal-dependent hydrolase (beta-lactamase superfamily II)